MLWPVSTARNLPQDGLWNVTRMRFLTSPTQNITKEGIHTMMPTGMSAVLSFESRWKSPCSITAACNRTTAWQQRGVNRDSQLWCSEDINAINLILSKRVRSRVASVLHLNFEKTQHNQKKKNLSGIFFSSCWTVQPLPSPTASLQGIYSEAAALCVAAPQLLCCRSLKKKITPSPQPDFFVFCC